MKKIIVTLFLILTATQLTNTFYAASRNKLCGSPFSNFGSWPYYSFDYYDRPFCPKVYDDYYS